MSSYEDSESDDEKLSKRKKIDETKNTIYMEFKIPGYNDHTDSQPASNSNIESYVHKNPNNLKDKLLDKEIEDQQREIRKQEVEIKRMIRMKFPK